MVIPVINWSETKPVSVEIEVKQNLTGKRINTSLASGRQVSVKYNPEKNRSIVSFEIDIADAIVVKR